MKKKRWSIVAALGITILGILFFTFFLGKNPVNKVEKDWVAGVDLTIKVGATFISKAGVPYEVIGIEKHCNMNRERLVLLSGDGRKMDEWITKNGSMM